jgi:hypothetical protein
MKELIVGGIFLLNGELDLRKENFEGLSVGDKVSVIGAYGRNGKVTSANRRDKWAPHITYAGKLSYQWPGVPMACENICFLLPPGGIKPDPGPCYVLYIVIEAEGEVTLMRNEFSVLGTDVKLFKSKFETV